ncbi:MAG: hypothetical protein ACRD22_02390 [Terriglobia bacterium]
MSAALLGAQAGSNQHALKDGAASNISPPPYNAVVFLPDETLQCEWFPALAEPWGGRFGG